jgi:hypothetical protein
MNLDAFVKKGFFSGLRLETLEPYIPLHETGQKRFAHAENQIIVYCEIHSATEWSLVLGPSRSLLFVPLFIKAYGTFHIF